MRTSRAVAAKVSGGLVMHIIYGAVVGPISGSTTQLADAHRKVAMAT